MVNFVLDTTKKRNGGRVKIDNLGVTNEHRVRIMGKYGIYLKLHDKKKQEIQRYTDILKRNI